MKIARHAPLITVSPFIDSIDPIRSSSVDESCAPGKCSEH